MLNSLLSLMGGDGEDALERELLASASHTGSNTKSSTAPAASSAANSHQPSFNTNPTDDFNDRVAEAHIAVSEHRFVDATAALHQARALLATGGGAKVATNGPSGTGQGGEQLDPKQEMLSSLGRSLAQGIVGEMTANYADLPYVAQLTAAAVAAALPSVEEHGKVVGVFDVMSEIITEAYAHFAQEALR
jgi:hypothetical protein